MNLKHEFNRIGHLLHDGADQSRHVTEHWAGKGIRNSKALARGARKQSRGLVAAEDALVGHVRGNPTLYIIGAAVLFGALVTKLIMEGRRARHTRQAPLL